MSKKKKFNIKFSKLLLPITKRIESFFNFIRYWNINKKKYFDLWIKTSDKKIFIGLAAIFLVIITYFLLPAFYNKDKVKSQVKNQLLQEFNLQVKLDTELRYGLLPRPHFSIESVKIVHDSKVISNSKYMKFFISNKNNFDFNKIKLNDLIFIETDFRIRKLDFNFFLNLLNNKVANKKIKFTKNKLFYLDHNDNVIFFSSLKRLDYSFQESLFNEMTSKFELFNLPIKLKINHDIVNENIFARINLNSLKLKIENNLFYNNDIKGKIDLNYINKNQNIEYSIKNNNLYFKTIDKEFTGEINIKPFFLSSNLILQNIKVKDFIKSNSILINFLKSEILNNKNLNGKLSIVVDGLTDLKHVDKIKFDIQLEEGLVFISNLNFVFKDSVNFNFNNVSVLADDNKLKFVGDVVLDFEDIQNFYNHFQIIRNFRKNIDQITSNFVFNLDDELFEFDELKIGGVDKKISDQYVNKFNSEKKDLLNKITFRNTVRDFFKTISLD